MKKRKRIILAILLCSILTVVIVQYSLHKQHSTPRDYQEIRDRGRIRVATTRGEIGYLSTDEQIKGYSYEMVKKMTDRDSLELEVVLLDDIETAIKGVQQQQYDLIAFPIPKTAAMAEKISLTTPLFSTKQVLIQQVDSLTNRPTITQHKELDSTTIHLPIDSPHRLRLKHIEEEIVIDMTLITVSHSTEELVKQVADGTIQLTICNYLQAKKLQQQYPNIDLSLPISFEQKYCWGVSKDSPQLLDRVNIFLSELLISTDYMELYSNYY